MELPLKGMMGGWEENMGWNSLLDRLLLQLLDIQIELLDNRQADIQKN